MSSGIYRVFNELNTTEDLTLAHRLFGGFIFIGLIIKVLSGMINTNTNSNVESAIGEATGTIWGYGIILFSLLGLVILKMDNNQPNKLFQNIPPSLYVLAAIVVWIMIMNATNYKEINKRTVPPTYYSWSQWSTAFIFINTIVIMIQYYSDSIKNPKLKSDFLKYNPTINVYIGFILFLNLIITLIQWIIIQNFSVDG